jgi:hypothetical protein
MEQAMPLISAASVLVYLACSPQCKKIVVEYPSQEACVAAMHNLRDKDGLIPIVASCQAPDYAKPNELNSTAKP